MTQKATLPAWADYGIHLGSIGQEAATILRLAHEGSCCYVGDVHTLKAAKAMLPKDAWVLELPGTPKADDMTVESIRQQTQSADALIAVGSGTINDLCKYASFLEGKPYSVIATAPSMNGYVSANASITVEGYKQTLLAHAPIAVLCDTEVLAAAPLRLKQAGLGDTLCRTTVQADWLLSHLLLDTPYEPYYFDGLRECEARLLENPQDSEALTEALLLSGLAMRDFGSSAPASQGEHMIAHTMEMLYPHPHLTYHGEEIAVTSLTMARRQEALLACESVQILKPRAKTRGPELAEEDFDFLPIPMRKVALPQFQVKFPNAQTIETLNHKLTQNWPEIRRQIRDIMLPATQLQQALESAGCPTTPEALHWKDSHYQSATQLARFTRDRFTFLDLVES